MNRLHASTIRSRTGFPGGCSFVNKVSTLRAFRAGNPRQSWVVDALLMRGILMLKTGSKCACRRKHPSTGSNPRQCWHVDALLPACVDARYFRLQPSSVLGCRRIWPFFRGGIRLHSFFITISIPFGDLHQLITLQVVGANHPRPLSRFLRMQTQGRQAGG